MHIDLDSCFASIEQQANPLLRGKPMAVAAYATPRGCILSASIEAKRYGIKTGMRVSEGRLLYPKLIVTTPDSSKYRDAHIKFRTIFQRFTPEVSPRSIDEAVLDFGPMMHRIPSLEEVAKTIKKQMATEIGEFVTCSIGIATNRFLAKMGASLGKPNGLEIITHDKVIPLYQKLQLTDLHGIADKNEARLNACNIFTPMDLFEASEQFLRKQVFGGIVGYYWYLRLRGWEIDQAEWATKSYGQQYALGKQTADPKELARLIMKLCEKMGRRLRQAGNAARGIHLAMVYTDHTHWHKGKKMEKEMYTTAELFKKAMWLFNQQPQRKVVRLLAVSCFDLIPAATPQLSLFDLAQGKKRLAADAMDKINDKYGEFVITPALMLDMDNTILDRIAFGRIRELEKVDVAY